MLLWMPDLITSKVFILHNNFYHDRTNVFKINLCVFSRLYFGDATSGVIQTIGYDGQERNILLTKSSPDSHNFFGMTLFQVNYNIIMVLWTRDILWLCSSWNILQDFANVTDKVTNMLSLFFFFCYLFTMASIPPPPSFFVIYSRQINW